MTRVATSGRPPRRGIARSATLASPIQVRPPRSHLRSTRQHQPTPPTTPPVNNDVRESSPPKPVTFSFVLTLHCFRLVFPLSLAWFVGSRPQRSFSCSSPRTCRSLKTLDLTPLAKLDGVSIDRLGVSFNEGHGLSSLPQLHAVTLPVGHAKWLRRALGDKWVEAERTATAVVLKRRGVELRLRRRADDEGGDAGPATEQGHRTERR